MNWVTVFDVLLLSLAVCVFLSICCTQVVLVKEITWLNKCCVYTNEEISYRGIEFIPTVEFHKPVLQINFFLSDHNLHSHVLTVDKSDYMVGSYGPRPAEYDFLTTMEEAPKGVLARGNYVIKSKFTDDDKHDHLSWEWNLNIKKDWKD